MKWRLPRLNLLVKLLPMLSERSGEIVCSLLSTLSDRMQLALFANLPFISGRHWFTTHQGLVLYSFTCALMVLTRYFSARASA